MIFFFIDTMLCKIDLAAIPSITCILTRDKLSMAQDDDIESDQSSVYNPIVSADD